MDILIGTIISALASAFALGLLQLITPAKVFRFVKIIGTYPLALVALWYLDFAGFAIFVAAAASSLLALVVTLVVERLSTPQAAVVTNRFTRNF
jgi:hypothetical protein